MRGSPLLRFLILAIALAATAAGLARVTSSRSAAAPVPVHRQAADTASEKSAVPYRLVLSAPAAEISFSDSTVIQPPTDGSPLTGSLALDPENPAVSLIVKWKTPSAPGEHRFAKLTLEPPGKETFTHVFDASDDIDDFVELPLSTVR